MMRALLIAVACLSVEQVLSQTTCKKGGSKIPHMKALWQDDFPNDLEVEALCDGTITVMDDGEICIDGRVNYEQLAEAFGTPIRQPAAKSISITGHLITASANVILGTEAHFLYDYVTSYSVGRSSNVPAGPGMADDVFVASRGMINGICLDKSFTRPAELYAITHDIWLPSGAKSKKYANANIIYASRYSVVAEYHKPSNVGPFFGTILWSVTTFFAGIVPSFIFQYIPILGATGIFRYFVTGSLSTGQVPVPITAPDVIVEDVQIDTEWDTLVSAMEDGLFTKDKVPLYFGVLAKKITPLSNKACWSVPVASIDIQAPKGSGDQLDKFIKETVLPALKSRGNVALHFGKRLDSGSEIVSSALSTYNRQCGVQLGVTPTECYHPACNRESTMTNFTWPPSIYQPAKQKQSKGSSDDSSDDRQLRS
ncbi:expressed unknown protein [Seminavis robusta]|uniref:Uncharacterized protein n=1 Tax=Seminavis robusta TaxID=568900 RepID=A0A9N8DBW6_9STRA|nr:expressed unknown protein [Seminavis robusta]|eukprot:Sro50_g029290.1 n/a (426) ;mRNA; f:135449-136726